MSSKTAPSSDADDAPAASDSRRPWSLAARLAVGFTVAAFALLLATLSYSYWQLSNSFAREDGQFLHEEVLEVESLLRSKPDGVAALRDHLRRESEAHLSSPLHIRVLDAKTGTSIAETEKISLLISASEFPAASVLGRHNGIELIKRDGPPLLATSESITVDGRPFIIQMALDRTFEQRLLGQYRRHMIGVLVFGLVVCAITGYAIARSGLRSLGRMAGVMEHVGSSTLNQRISGAFPSELSVLAASFNAMLQRLEDSFARLSRFSADIAHELRTPIHNIRGTVEVTLNKPRSPQEAQAMLAPCLEECERMGRLIDNLLFVARAENPQTQIARQRVDVMSELGKVQEFFEAAAAEAGVTIAVAPASGAVEAELDRLLLQQAVCNLVENALAHTPRDGRVTLGAHRENGHVQVEVVDTGCGIPAEHLPLVFERLHRVDPSRSKNTGGTGLGLAIVKSIATLHRGTVSVESKPSIGSRFTLTLPVR